MSLHLLNDRSLYRFELFAAHCRVLLSGLASKLQLSRIRQVLRYPEADICEPAVVESGKGPRAGDREVLH